MILSRFNWYVNNDAHIIVAKIIGPMINTLSKCEIWISHRIIKKHRYNVVYTDLPPNYYDIDAIMEAAMVKLLRRYIEDECGGVTKLRAFTDDLASEQGNSSLDNQVAHQQSAIDIYEWFVTTKPALMERCATCISKWVEGSRKSGHRFFGDNVITGLPEYELESIRQEAQEYYIESNDLQKTIDDTTDEMLELLVNLRRTLWT